jgi:hypothetical protein
VGVSTVMIPWCMQEIGRRSGMRKRMGKRKRGGGGGENIQLGKQREREEENEKWRYFGSCEKIK